MAIYTRKGDKGKTSLRDGKKVFKNNQRVDAYGTVDELNTGLGVVLTTTKDNFIKNSLISIQNDLFEIGAKLANPKDKTKEFGEYFKKQTLQIEKEIDKMTKAMPELKNFILPGGGEVGAKLHLARTIARRAERKIVTLSQKEKIEEEILIYFNRLSDYLFTLARFANFKDKKKEIIWSSFAKVSEDKKSY
ncbi:cob(I)yrinic acid a,c-diamide adenosyltransferase [Patescibacteria group bacterium]|nr:cob(I)yrinic acid a,c-diamide adenosyltransferase [Patescibacteria group bacterium]